MAGRFVGEPAVGIAAAVRAGRAKPAEVLEEHLERIAALDGRLGAFQALRVEEVRAEARALQDRDDLDRLGRAPWAGWRWAGCRGPSRTTSPGPGWRPATARPRPATSRRRPTTS